MPGHERIAVIGLGHVGATAAYALMLRALASEIVLVDNASQRAAAEAQDITDANALARPTKIWAGDYADAAAADVAVITAGVATHGAQSRLSVAMRSAEIVQACIADLCSSGFAGILLIASNPVDLMTRVAVECSGLPIGRVLGTGTLLDTNRLRAAIAAKLGVASADVDALVLGEHGDSGVALFSQARVGGLPLDSFSEEARTLDRAGVAASVRDAAYQIIAGKGFTSFGVATAIVRICEAIIRDEGVVLPVSSALWDVAEYRNVCLSMPCILSAAGIERALVPSMTAEEAQGLAVSAKQLDGAYLQMLADADNAKAP